MLRVVDGSDGLGLERDEHDVVDGFPDVGPAVIGELVARPIAVA